MDDTQFPLTIDELAGGTSVARFGELLRSVSDPEPSLLKFTQSAILNELTSAITYTPPVDETELLAGHSLEQRHPQSNVYPQQLDNTLHVDLPPSPTTDPEQQQLHSARKRSLPDQHSQLAPTSKRVRPRPSNPSPPTLVAALKIENVDSVVNAPSPSFVSSAPEFTAPHHHDVPLTSPANSTESIALSHHPRPPKEHPQQFHSVPAQPQSTADCRLRSQLSSHQQQINGNYPGTTGVQNQSQQQQLQQHLHHQRFQQQQQQQQKQQGQRQAPQQRQHAHSQHQQVLSPRSEFDQAPNRTASQQQRSQRPDNGDQAPHHQKRQNSKQHRNNVKSHTRKCREKVNEKFDRLLEALPDPPPGEEVKHKAQILDYTIRVFRELITKRASLRTEIALSSHDALEHWIASTLADASKSVPAGTPVPILALLEGFANLYCIKKNWKYGEMWVVNNGNPPQLSLDATVFNCVDHATSAALIEFSEETKRLCPTTTSQTGGLVSRTFASQRPEWLPDVCTDSSAFTRAPLAERCKLDTALAVPVLLRPGRVAAVLLFADVKERTYSTSDIGFVSEYANIIGKKYAEYITNRNNTAMPSVQPQLETRSPTNEQPRNVGVQRRPAAGFNGSDNGNFVFAAPLQGPAAVPQSGGFPELFTSSAADGRLYPGSDLNAINM